MSNQMSAAWCKKRNPISRGRDTYVHWGSQGFVSGYRIYSNKRHIWDKKVNKRPPRISAAVPMRCLFEEFRITKRPLQSNSKTALQMEETESLDHWSIRSARRDEWWQSKDASVSYCKIFVQIENIPLNWKKIFICRVQFLNKLRPRISAAFKARKI